MRNNRGFTLIELMIVVVIVAILASVAYPSYQEYIRRGARGEARAAILQMVQLQERNFTDRGAYATINSGALANSWQNYNWSGSNFASRKYDITVALGVAVGGTTYPYVVTATPANGFADPKCGNLTLRSDGIKGSSVGDTDTCWR